MAADAAFHEIDQQLFCEKQPFWGVKARVLDVVAQHHEVMDFGNDVRLLELLDA